MTQDKTPTDAEIETLREAFDWEGWTDPKAAQRAFTRAVLARWGTASAGERDAECPTCHAPCKATVHERGGDWGWGTSDAQRTTYHYVTTPPPSTQALLDVIAERHRQIHVEGFTTHQDDSYLEGELESAAASYIFGALDRVIQKNLLQCGLGILFGGKPIATHAVCSSKLLRCFLLQSKRLIARRHTKAKIIFDELIHQPH